MLRNSSSNMKKPMRRLLVRAAIADAGIGCNKHLVPFSSGLES